MFTSRMISFVVASGLVLGSMGTAFAASQTKEGYQLFLQGKTGAAMTDSSAVSATSANNPFALYATHRDPQNIGTPVASSHLATSRDDAISQVSPDPFK